MEKSNFVDYVKIHARSGKGGAGSTHLRTEKFVPKGGPDGGDGGRGGHIILRGNAQLWTLLPLKYRKHIKADHGEAGGKAGRTGARGEDVVLDVPLGTIVREAETNTQLTEITEEGEEFILLEGGRGGLGNTHFKSATNQTPRYAQPGEPAKEGWYILELKVLADVGLVGFPNAGKSTLLSVITAAKPKIADYPFTTMVPNLGIVPYRDHRSFIMADIPGIIEGAHEGKGLGHRFLRHIERNAVLLFMIPVDSRDIRKEFEILLKEVEQYKSELAYRPRLLAITKIDMADPELQQLIVSNLPQDVPYVFISAVAQTGLDDLKDKLWTLLNEPVISGD